MLVCALLSASACMLAYGEQQTAAFSPAVAPEEVHGMMHKLSSFQGP